MNETTQSDIDKREFEFGSQIIDERADLIAFITDAWQQCESSKRLIVGVAGAPASGKSTLAQWLADTINDHQAPDAPAIVVPMDGFHLDNMLLDKRNLRDVKGAPHTFDVAGFLSLLQRLAAPINVQTARHASEHSDDIHIPLFDRTMDLARCAAASVTTSHRIVIVEGNYLLLDRPGWRDTASLFDCTVMLDVPLPVLEKRLTQRWIDHGMPLDRATMRARTNDIPNAQVVASESTRPQLLLRFKTP